MAKKFDKIESANLNTGVDALFTGESVTNSNTEKTPKRKNKSQGLYVQIDDWIINDLNKLKDETGIPIKRIVRDALIEYLDKERD